jgi:hypothetical protein
MSCRHHSKKSKNLKRSADTGVFNYTPRTKIKPHYNNPLFKQYSQFLSKLDTGNMESSGVAARKYVDLFGNQGKNNCDSAYMIFDEFYEKLTNHIDELSRRDTTIKYDSLLTDSNRKYYSKLSEKLTLYAQKLKDNGLRVYQSEGDDYIGQDLDFVAKWFYKYVSPAMKLYLIQLNKEDKEGFSEDAELIISPYQFVNRTIWWEKFASKYPNIDYNL